MGVVLVLRSVFRLTFGISRLALGVTFTMFRIVVFFKQKC